MATYDDVVPVTRPALPRSFTRFYHPFHQYAFLVLVGNVPDENSAKFGVYFTVAFEACKIIAYNQAGYLSTSRYRGEGRVDAPADNSDVILTSRNYYYHLDVDLDLNYPICIDFDCWNFPHDMIPQSWTTPPGTSVFRLGEQELGGSSLSQRIKDRDVSCRVTKWEAGMTTTHIMPKAHRTWMEAQKMEAYSRLGGDACDDTRNQFAMRFDIQFSQFDAGNAVIVPIAGSFCLYFIKAGLEAEHLYHLRVFDTTDLSHQYLYARFAWAVIKSATGRYHACPSSMRNDVKLSGGGGGGGEKEEEGDEQPPTKRRKLKATTSTAPIRHSGRLKEKATQQEASGSKPAGRRSNRQTGTKKNKGKKGKQAVQEAEELADDIQKAKIVAPFFLDPDGVADPYNYETMMWYPGKRAFERLKENYINSHPSVRAHSNPSVADDGLSDADDRAWSPD